MQTNVREFDTKFFIFMIYEIDLERLTNMHGDLSFCLRQQLIFLSDLFFSWQCTRCKPNILLK